MGEGGYLLWFDVDEDGQDISFYQPALELKQDGSFTRLPQTYQCQIALVALSE
jgi:hypothetical protein